MRFSRLLKYSVLLIIIYLIVYRMLDNNVFQINHKHSELISNDDPDTLEFIEENNMRKQMISDQCRAFIQESRGQQRLIARTVQQRRPRAQMFTVVPRKK